jgi:hypothetical protein
MPAEDRGATRLSAIMNSGADPVSFKVVVKADLVGVSEDKSTHILLGVLLNPMIDDTAAHDTSRCIWQHRPALSSATVRRFL